jgi:hypothetical protein
MNLSTDIWVYALIRRVQLAGSAATVVRKGDATGGAVLVRTYDPRSREAHLYALAQGGAGESVWMQPLAEASEPDLDAYAERAAKRDPDLWVVEIEATNGKRFLTEDVEGG